jgi:hypothetical protein
VNHQRTEPQLTVDSPLTVDEVRLLWSFVHGDIMNSLTRRMLREHRGLCDRHSWGHAVVEIELWQARSGHSEGHQPFDVAVLYDDLLETMIGDLQAATAHPHRVRRTLTSQGHCLICHDLKGPELSGMAIGYANSNSIALAEEANRLVHTREWLSRTASEWRTFSCPECRSAEPTADVFSDDVEGLHCRQHLLEMEKIDPEDIRASLDFLKAAHADLRRLVRSMTEGGQASDLSAEASWISTIAWFHKSTFPLQIDN